MADHLSCAVCFNFACGTWCLPCPPMILQCIHARAPMLPYCCSIPTGCLWLTAMVPPRSLSAKCCAIDQPNARTLVSIHDQDQRQKHSERHLRGTYSFTCLFHHRSTSRSATHVLAWRRVDPSYYMPRQCSSPRCALQPRYFADLQLALHGCGRRFDAARSSPGRMGRFARSAGRFERGARGRVDTLMPWQHENELHFWDKNQN